MILLKLVLKITFITTPHETVIRDSDGVTRIGAILIFLLNC
jgi:hypothetical protein